MKLCSLKNYWRLKLIAQLSLGIIGSSCGVDSYKDRSTEENLLELSRTSLEDGEDQQELGLVLAPVTMLRGTISRFDVGDVKIAYLVPGESMEVCEKNRLASYRQAIQHYSAYCSNAPQAPTSGSMLRSSKAILMSIGEKYSLSDSPDQSVCVYAQNIACIAYPYADRALNPTVVVKAGDIPISKWMATDLQKYWKLSEVDRAVTSVNPKRPLFDWRPIDPKRFEYTISFSERLNSSITNASAAKTQVEQQMRQKLNIALLSLKRHYEVLSMPGILTNNGKKLFQVDQTSQTVTSVPSRTRGQFQVNGSINISIAQQGLPLIFASGYSMAMREAPGLPRVTLPGPTFTALPRSPGPDFVDPANPVCPAGTIAYGQEGSASKWGMSDFGNSRNTNTVTQHCALAKDQLRTRLSASKDEFANNSCAFNAPALTRFHSVAFSQNESICFAGQLSPTLATVKGKSRFLCCAQAFAPVQLSTSNLPVNGGTNRTSTFVLADGRADSIQCGNNCGPKQLKPNGQEITLTATPNTDFTFKQWTCTANGNSRVYQSNPVTISTSQSQHCTAEFLSLPAGYGVIRVELSDALVTSPFLTRDGRPLIHCGLMEGHRPSIGPSGGEGYANDCTAVIPLNTSVSLIATPATGHLINYFFDEASRSLINPASAPLGNSPGAACMRHVNRLVGRSSSSLPEAYVARCLFPTSQRENLIRVDAHVLREHCPANSSTCIRQ